MQELEVDSSVNDISITGNKSSCSIIDLMALVQMALAQFCLGTLKCVYPKLYLMPLDMQRLVICSDRYGVQESIACFKRLRQRKAFIPEREILHVNQTLPSNFKEFLMNAKKQMQFCNFSFRFMDIIHQTYISRITKVTIGMYQWFSNRCSGKQCEKHRSSSKQPWRTW